MASQSHLGDAPELASLIGSVKVMLDAFDEGRIDRLYIMHNRFVNTMTQLPVAEQLLPLKAVEDDRPRNTGTTCMSRMQKPSLMVCCCAIESQVYQGVVEK